ncbi:MAG TPA: NAD(P)/FAD-dependent oxidoreductase [Rhizomicrobium sp.]|jgi:NADH dehydrogenase|nr:NAD(P)/FAD-dependent oxidoreductase [Rhizomicrobium sp.]
MDKPEITLSSRPRIIVVGAGFGGLSAVHALRHAVADVILVDKQNYHLFQPLLYQVATAGLSPADIAQPIRSMLRDQKNTQVLMGEVDRVDLAGRLISIRGQGGVAYDCLIIATGARHSYFGKDQWAHYAPGIKTLDDAIRVRSDVLLAFERAETEHDPAKRRALLSFLIIGGGPTGVEMAGAIAELARHSIARDFRSITPHCAKVILLEAGPRLLPAMPESLSTKARHALEELGVDVRLGTAVTGLARGMATIGSERIDAETIVWAAGVRGSPAGDWLNVPVDKAGRVKVSHDLSVPGYPNVFVPGDTALIQNCDGSPVPGVAAAAKQEGAYVGRLMARRLAGEQTIEPFRYVDQGNLATIGRSNAVADFGRIRLAGFLAWLLWCVAHVYFLIGFRNRLSVALNWAWLYLTYQRGARLITGQDDADMEPFRKAA